MNRPRSSRARARVVLLCVSLAARGGGAQSRATRAPASAAATVRTGYQLVLHGAEQAVHGHEAVYAGTAFEVRGFATLRALPGARVRVVLRPRDEAIPRAQWRVLAELRADARGAFVVRVAAPSVGRHTLVFELDDPSEEPSRRTEPYAYDVALEVTPSRELLLRTDRHRYEPGEPLRAWVLVRDAVSGAPVPGVALQGSVAGDRSTAVEAVTGPSGAVLLTLRLAEALSGPLDVAVREPEGAVATTVIQVGSRAMQAMQVDAGFDREWASPGETVHARVSVRDPSGLPLEGARVAITREGRADAEERVTGRDGVVDILWQSSALARGQGDELVARVTHEAFGAVEARAHLAVSRARYEADANAAHGALVAGVDDAVFLEVRTRDGRPAPAGLALRVEGTAVGAAGTTVTTDARGCAEVRVRLREGDAARHDSDAEAPRVTTLRVRAEGAPIDGWTFALPVAVGARVGARVRRALVSPGEALALELVAARAQREQGASAPPASAWVEVLAPSRGAWTGVSTQSAWRVLSTQSVALGDGVTTVQIALPAALRGVGAVRVREQLVGEHASLRTLVEPFLVAPREPFSLRVRPEREQYAPRSTAALLLQTSRPRAGLFAALVLRDVSADAGEAPFEAPWAPQIDDAWLTPAPGPNGTNDEALLRGSLVELVAPLASVRAEGRADVEHLRAGTAHEPVDLARGLLQNAWGERGALVEHGLDAAEQALEAAVERGTPRVLRRLAGQLAFASDAVESLVTQGALEGEQVRTLGGAPLTLAMIEAEDPGFRLDAVLRVVARRRWARVLRALARFVEPDEGPSPVANDPPERWLSRMLERGALTTEALRDPWGGAFAFRRINDAALASRWAVSSRAVGYAVVSAGPDGVFDTRDDVRDPHARVVTQGTVYARVSGEDTVLAALATMSPGQSTLHAQLAAFDRRAYAEHEEEIGDAAEAVDDEDLGGLSISGSGSGGGGVGYGSGAGRGLGGRGVSAPRVRAAPPVVRGFARGAALLRERFPATLFAEGSVALDAQGQARVEVPIADALTTFRAYVIAWNGEGFLASSRADVRVDQEVIVDAATPTRVTEGDRLFVPLRVSNHGRTPMRVRVRVEGEGVLASVRFETILAAEPGATAQEHVEINAPAVGALREDAREGALRVRAFDAAATGDASELDAVRRRLHVEPEGRAVYRSSEATVGNASEWVHETPADAVGGGRATVTLRVGALAFDGLASGLEHDELTWRAWSTAFVGEVDFDNGELRTALRQWTQSLGSSSVDARWRAQAPSLARVMNVLWPTATNDARTDPARRLRAVERLSVAVLGTSVDPEHPLDGSRAFPQSAAVRAQVLLALAPMLREAREADAAYPELRALASLADALERSLLAGPAPEQPGELLEEAAALALTQVDRARLGRARELYRRALRSLQRSGAAAWIELPRADRVSMAQSTALAALVALALGENDTAVALLRGLAREPRWINAPSVRSLVRATLTLLDRPSRAPWLSRAREIPEADAGRPQASARLWVDGRAYAFELVGQLARADVPSLRAPGAHAIRVECDRCGVAVARAEVDHMRAWVPVARGAQLAAEGSIDPGSPRVGARSEAVLTVRFRGVYALARPLAQVTLPTGAELDPEALRALTRSTAGPPRVDGRVLTLRLRALRPAGVQQITLPLRWSIAGSLQGFGVALYAHDRPGALVAVTPAQTVRVDAAAPRTPRDSSSSRVDTTPVDRVAAPTRTPPFNPHPADAHTQPRGPSRLAREAVFR